MGSVYGQPRCRSPYGCEFALAIQHGSSRLTPFSARDAWGLPRMEMPALLTNDTWTALVEAEDGYGEGAEAHALAMAAAARKQGDEAQAHI